MNRNQIIDFIVSKYGLSRTRAEMILNEHMLKRATALDRVREEQFNRKIDYYSKSMQFA